MRTVTSNTDAVFSIVAPIVLSIGDTLGGGRIAYILQPGDLGYDSNVQHGLIAATDILINPGVSNGFGGVPGGIQWINNFNASLGTSTEFGSGAANTYAMIQNDLGTTDTTAISLLKAYTGGGYTDWYLPSIEELEKINVNRIALGISPEYELFWSSSESDVCYAWAASYNGSIVTDVQIMYMEFLVLPVRSF